MEYEIVLRDAYKGYTLDQDKLITPQETVRRFRERLKRVDLDILKETVRIDKGRLGIPVYFSVCGRDAHEIIGTKKQMGKGGTPQQAEASAVMELAERFSFFSFCKDETNFLIDTYKKVKDKALAFEKIAQSVHDKSPDLDLAERIFSEVPLKWTWAYNLTRKESVLIPFSWFFAINEFNGPSAGNCVEEAIIQGICEVVERHVSSLVSRNKLSVPGIDLSSTGDSVANDLIGKYKKVGVRLFANDFTLDTGIPTVGVLAYDPSTFPEQSEIVWTAGTTPSPDKALIRALTEVAQLAGDFDTLSRYVASGLPKFKNLDEAKYITEPKEIMNIGDLPDLSDENIRIEIENCLEALSRVDLEVFEINVTHPRLEIPAFYTIIPGAHFRERAVGTSVGMFTAKLISEWPDKQWAISMLEWMKNLIPKRYYVHFYLGFCHLSIGKYSEAVKFFEESLALEPTQEDIASIYSYMGVALKEIGEFRRALEVLEQAEQIDSDRTDVYNLMGYCYFKLKEYEKAIACFEKVLLINPTSAIDYANIGSNYRELGNVDAAIHYYRIALELDPTIEFAKTNLERLLGN